MKHQVKAPNVGESITEVSILKWAKQSGQWVNSGDLLLEIESDKATVEIVAETAGVLTTLKPVGERIPVGEVIGVIDDEPKAVAAAPNVSPTVPPPPTSAPMTSPPKAPPPPMSVAAVTAASVGGAVLSNAPTPLPTPGPAARKALAESGANPATIQGTGKDGRITKGDVQGAGASAAGAPTYAPPATLAPAAAPSVPTGRPGERRVALSMLRQRIAERLVQAQHTAAILTTFNEADMSAVMAYRSKHKDAFKAKHGVSLGFMSFFTRGCVEALRVIPEVNAYIDGRDVLYHDFYDIGIAVGTERGLVVPVLRDAGPMGLAQIEKGIGALAEKAKNSKLSIADLSGGTFTISNGGVYGSLLSTPILNPPQSGILGMHKIMERPIVIDGKVEARPMMYLALSYDHRIIDGKGAVTFLVTLKDFLEHPEKLGLDY